MKLIGLRIDVDTFRGTQIGVPGLCRLLAKYDILGSFYFSVGPDNMGRHLWRLLRPAFLWKMLRSKAPGLYGWSILWMGTAWRGPLIGKKLGHSISECAEGGHEIGFHAYDHHRMQMKFDRLTAADLANEFELGLAELERITGHEISTSAAPGWRMNNDLLLAKEKYHFAFNSDCRGHFPFYPVVEGRKLAMQIPVTLPTYDEILGRNGITDANYNDYILSLLCEDAPNVLTIHAEVEGIKQNMMFEDFLRRALEMDYKIVPLGEIAAEFANVAPEGEIVLADFPGREGKLAVQK